MRCEGLLRVGWGRRACWGVKYGEVKVRVRARVGARVGVRVKVRVSVVVVVVVGK